ncbi:sigma factor [Streptomyces sp. UG1]|uniref:RNA polymerase sigma factor n=1 Tax=Streptomyces sp. UG1 TaxID=3417652 RepID=UPI003CEF1507
MESTGDTSVEPPADAEVHRRLVYGDESALAEVYAAYGGLVRRVAVCVTRSAAAAEGVAQEVFAHLWSRPYSFDAGRGSLRTWLSLLAHRRAVDWVRSETRHRKAAADDSALQAIPDAAPGPDETVVDRELPPAALRARRTPAAPARGRTPRLLRRPHLPAGRRGAKRVRGSAGTPPRRPARTLAAPAKGPGSSSPTLGFARAGGPHRGPSSGTPRARTGCDTSRCRGGRGNAPALPRTRSGIPEGTAKTRLRSALRALAETLADPPDPALERGA